MKIRLRIQQMTTRVDDFKCVPRRGDYVVIEEGDNAARYLLVTRVDHYANGYIAAEVHCDPTGESPYAKDAP